MLDNWSSSLPRHLLTQSHPRRVVVTLFRPLPSRPGPRPRRQLDSSASSATESVCPRPSLARPGPPPRPGLPPRPLRPDAAYFCCSGGGHQCDTCDTYSPAPGAPPLSRSFLLTLQGSDWYSLPVSPICLLHYVVLSHPLCKVLPKICLWLQKVLASPSFRGPVACPSLSSSAVPSTRTMITPKHLGNGIPTFE